MARIQPLDPGQAGNKARTLLDGVQRKIGKVPNVFRTMANSPAVLDAYLSIGGAMANASLGPAVREQLAVSIANVNGCQYCASAHTAIGAKLGVDAAELMANLEGRSSDAKLKAALDFARSIVTRRGWVTDDELQRVRDAGYTEGEIVEIIAVVAQNIFTNYINHVAQTEIDFPKVDVTPPVTT